MYGSSVTNTLLHYMHKNDVPTSAEPKSCDRIHFRHSDHLEKLNAQNGLRLRTVEEDIVISPCFKSPNYLIITTEEELREEV